MTFERITKDELHHLDESCPINPLMPGRTAHQQLLDMAGYRGHQYLKEIRCSKCTYRNVGPSGMVSCRLLAYAEVANHGSCDHAKFSVRSLPDDFVS